MNQIAVFFLCLMFFSDLQAESNQHFDSKRKFLEANYLYAATAPSGQVAYLFGSSHGNYAAVPMRMGQCAKDLLADSATVVIEADEVESKKYMATRPDTLSMNKVLPLLSGEQVEALNKRLYGTTASTTDTRLLSLDVMQVDSMLRAQHTMRLIPYLGLPDHGLDVEVRMAARFLNKTLGALETAREQHAFIRAVPAEQFAKGIGEGLKDLAAARSHLELAEKVALLFRAVSRGDESTLLENALPDEGSFLDIVGAQRNPSQVQKIDAWLHGDAKKPVFFALGAMHLVGKQGVPALLEAKGYSVKRLCESGSTSR